MEFGIAIRTAPSRVRISAPIPSRAIQITKLTFRCRFFGILMENSRKSSPLQCIQTEEDSADSPSETTTSTTIEVDNGNGKVGDENGDKLGVPFRRSNPSGQRIHYVGPAFQFRMETKDNIPRNILEEIVWNKDSEVLLMKERQPLITLVKLLKDAPPVRDFIGALKEFHDKTSMPALIAEVKKASPSRGVLRENFDPVSIAKSYEENGAACLSVLTDKKYFQGSFENLVAIRKAGIKCPLLCKEFIIDAWQIFYARCNGADAILLIAAILPDLDIKYMLKICKKLGLVALIEVHDEKEMDRILAIEDVQLIGINNRNLETFEVDISNTKKLLEGERGRIIGERGIIVVGESGLFTPEDISFVQNAGVKAVLVGESLIKQEDPGKAIATLYGKDLSEKQ